MPPTLQKLLYWLTGTFRPFSQREVQKFRNLSIIIAMKLRGGEESLSFVHQEFANESVKLNKVYIMAHMQESESSSSESLASLEAQKGKQSFSKVSIRKVFIKLVNHFAKSPSSEKIFTFNLSRIINCSFHK